MARHMVKRMQQHLTEEGEIVVPYPHHRKLQKSCLATSISLAAAIYLELFDCASLSFLVLLASIVYWHNPRRGLRRNVDMTLAFGGLFYQMLVQAPKLVSTQHTPLLLYLVGMAAGSFCYMAARYHSKKEDFARGSAWHASLHFWANVGNLFLYWGLSRLEDPSASGREAVGI